MPCSLVDFEPTHPPALSEKPPVRNTSDSRDRMDESLRYMLPQDSNVPYDMKDVIAKVRGLLPLGIREVLLVHSSHPTIGVQEKVLRTF